jgi:hypothetical protein
MKSFFYIKLFVKKILHVFIYILIFIFALYIKIEKAKKSEKLIKIIFLQINEVK